MPTPFHNQEYNAEHASAASLFWGILEHDNFEQNNMLIAAFAYDTDAREYAEYLSTVGRTVEVVELMDYRTDNW